MLSFFRGDVAEIIVYSARILFTKIKRSTIRVVEMDVDLVTVNLFLLIPDNRLGAIESSGDPPDISIVSALFRISWPGRNTLPAMALATYL